MRNDIKINDKKHTIEVTKKFAKAASYYGSDEYIDLQGARRDYPNYRVVTKTPSRKKSDSKKPDHFKGLTYAYMVKYIKNHDNDGKIMAEFEEKREELAINPASYKMVKEWFFNKFPEVGGFQKKSEELQTA